MFCLAKANFSLAGALAVGALSLLAAYLGRRVGGLLARAKGHREAEDEARKLDDWLASLGTSDAKRRAEELLADPELFEVTPASTVAPDDLLAKTAPEARDFLTRYRNVRALPLADAEIGSDWLQQSADGGAVSIGWSEYFGSLRMRLGEEQIYSETRPEDQEPLARSIYHLVILLADAG